MRPIGVPTLLSAERLFASTAILRRQSETARIELTTGRIADLPAALGARIGEAFSIRASIDLIAVRRQGLAQANLTAAAVQRTLGSIGIDGRVIASDALAANGRQDETALGVAAVAARAEFESAIAQLNTRIGGHALFGGDATDRQALSNAGSILPDVQAIYSAAADIAEFETNLDLYFNDPAGKFRAVIYTGGAGAAPTIEIGAGERIDVSARADEQPLRDILRGLSTIAAAASAPPSALRDGALAIGAGAVLEGETGLIARRSEIGVSEQRAAEAGQRLEAEETALSEAYNERTARDPFEAASRLQALEAQLNASFVITSRLSQLSLANYLR